MIKSLKEKILKTNKKIILTTHMSPDGDAVGSEIALAHVLKKLGKDVSIINQDAIPHQFKFLEKYFDSYAIENITNKEEVLVFLIDVDTIDKVGDSIKTFLTTEISSEIIIIDHHNPEILNKDYQYIVDDKASSTGEIMYGLIKNELKMDINKQIAEAIYAAIVSDTRSFRYSKTTSTAHRIAAELMDSGIDHEDIQTKIFGSNTPGQLWLLGYALSNIKISDNKKIASTILPLSELKKFN
ncbi:MAG: DHH family phosphoesterase, partial [Pseudomonadota bacterium]